MTELELHYILLDQKMRYINKIISDYDKPNKIILVSADTQTKGSMLYHNLLKQVRRFVTNDPTFYMSKNNGYTMDDILRHYITKDVCTYISYKWLGLMLKYNLPGNAFNISHRQLIKDLYMQKLGLNDEDILNANEKYKISQIQQGYPDYITIESDWEFNQHKHKEKLEQRKIRAKEERERKKEERRKKWELEEGPMPTSNQMKAFKLALQKQFAEKEGTSPTA